jgi:hypothetical protein
MALRGLEIDFETANRITILTLKEHVGYLKEELRQHIEQETWMHPEDVVDTPIRISQIESVIKYFGGSV